MRPVICAAVTLTATIDGALLSADDGVVAVPLYIPLSREALRSLIQDGMGEIGPSEIRSLDLNAL